LRRSISSIVLLALPLLPLTTAGALASPIIGVTGLSDPAQTIGFDESVPNLGGPLPQGVPVSDQFIDFGVTFAIGTIAGSSPLFTEDLAPTFQVNGRTLVNDFGGSNCQGTTQGCPPFRIHFTQDVGAAAFQMITRPGISSFEALLNGTAVERFSTTTGGLGGSAATNFVFGFDNIVFNEILVSPGGPGDEAFIDNVQYKLPTDAPVPEPQTVALLAAAVIGIRLLGGARRRETLDQRRPECDV
jgi:hypothetical protein